MRTLRDPIHDFIPLTGKEVDVVDTRIFQRLRGIRQLALANLVYPGAMHTRFEHSLGVCHISKLLANSLGIPSDDVNILCLTALLHDLGHGPFSHVSDDALEFYANRVAIGARITQREGIHELVTQDLIRTDLQLKRIIGERDLEKVVQMLSRGYGDPALKSIVSGPLDADKQDYLLRDSYFCGVKYGVFDLRQLHRAMKISTDPYDGRRQLMITPDGVHALETIRPREVLPYDTGLQT